MKLKYDELLSNVAFTFNLRRYIKVKGASVKGDASLTGTIPSYGKIWAEVGRCRLTLSYTCGKRLELCACN